MALFFYGRDRETDHDNHPALRYFGAPYLMLALGIGSATFAAYQWLDPDNHVQPEDLFVSSYIPAAFALVALGMALYFVGFARYCATAPSCKRTGRTGPSVGT